MMREVLEQVDGQVKPEAAQREHHRVKLAASLQRGTTHPYAPESHHVRGEAMSHQETGKARLAKEHCPGPWILEAQVTGERGGEDKIADEFRLEDENRADVCARVLQHLFSGTGGSGAGNWAETMSGFGAVTRTFA
ncbi:hypothetical protein [Mesorhizobium sp. M0965]|uniref:hypothetical protein n=1 Tax=unclassified Mesorhizobium TaxID=325217 RepID=UPI00333DA76B